MNERDKLVLIGAGAAGLGAAAGFWLGSWYKDKKWTKFIHEEILPALEDGTREILDTAEELEERLPKAVEAKVIEEDVQRVFPDRNKPPLGMFTDEVREHWVDYAGGGTAFTSEEVEPVVKKTVFEEDQPVKDEPVVKKIFEEEQPNEDEIGPGWDFDTEIKRRTPGHPHVIHITEWESSEFTQIEAIWYESDEVLVADDENLPMLNVGELINFDNLKWGWGSDDPHVVYVRNPKQKVDYMITRDPGSWEIEVAGLVPEG